MEDPFAYIQPLLFLQKLYGFHNLQNNATHKFQKIISNFYLVFLIFTFIFVGLMDFEVIWQRFKQSGENNLANFVMMVNLNFYNLITLSFYCNYCRIKKYSSKVLNSFKKFDKVSDLNFRVKVDQKNLRTLSLKLLLFPIVVIIYSVVDVGMNSAELPFLKVVLRWLSFYFNFCLILQFAFYVFICACFFYRLNSLHMEILKLLRQRRFAKCEVDVLIGLFDEMFVIMKNIKKGFSVNILLVLGKNYFIPLKTSSLRDQKIRKSTRIAGKFNV